MIYISIQFIFGYNKSLTHHVMRQKNFLADHFKHNYGVKINFIMNIQKNNIFYDIA